MFERGTFYRLSMPHDGNGTSWRVLEVTPFDVLLSCQGVGRKQEYIVIRDGEIVESVRPEFLGARPDISEVVYAG